MLSGMRTKIRSLVEDIPVKKDIETFEYENSSIFTLSEPNIATLTKITKNGVELGSGDYSFDSDTNELTISVALSSGDIIIVKYTYNKYSDTELDSYIRAALVWLSTFTYPSSDFELETNYIVPTPDNSMLDLIVLIASILISPNYSEYSLPNVRVKYPRTWSKQEKIERLINRYTFGRGVIDIIEWD